MCLSLDECIVSPNCKMLCVKHGKVPDCCGRCVEKKGYYRAGEKRKRFTFDEIQEIEAKFNMGTGFSSKTGCVLPRHLRSEMCVKHICDNIPFDKEEMEGVSCC